MDERTHIYRHIETRGKRTTETYVLKIPGQNGTIGTSQIENLLESYLPEEHASEISFKTPDDVTSYQRGNHPSGTSTHIYRDLTAEEQVHVVDALAKYWVQKEAEKQPKSDGIVLKFGQEQAD